MNAPDEYALRLFPEPEQDDLSSHAHRQLIGGVGLVLPPLLWLMAGFRPTEGLHPWELLGSISAYYYTAAVSAFAGILVALALFLLTYRGYNNKYGHRDRVAAIIAGGAAFLVAFFPAGAPGTLPAPSWWTPLLGWIHYVSAVVLFGSFIFFSLFQFTKSKPGNVDPGKRVRNWIYISCGVAIVVCMVWAVIASFIGAQLFWPETLALEFFAISWLVKGRADKTAVAAGKQTLYYGRHPRQLVDKAWSAIQGKQGTGSMSSQNDA